MPTNFVVEQILMLIAGREIELIRRELSLFLSKRLFCIQHLFCAGNRVVFYATPVGALVYLKPENEIPVWGRTFYRQPVFFWNAFRWLAAQTLIQLGHRRAVYFSLGLGVVLLFGIGGQRG